MGHEENEIFDRMQKLLDRLPAMQAEQARLERHYEAAHLDRLARRAEADMQELASIDDEIARVQGLLASVHDGLGGQESDRLQRLILFLGNQRGYKAPPAQTSKDEFEQVLSASSFSCHEDCRAALLTSEDVSAYEHALCSYRGEYQRTLAACQALEEEGRTAFSVKSAHAGRCSATIRNL